MGFNWALPSFLPPCPLPLSNMFEQRVKHELDKWSNLVQKLSWIFRTTRSFEFVVSFRNVNVTVFTNRVCNVLGREGPDHHGQPPSVQNPWLVPQQTEGREGWQIFPGYVQRPRQQTPWGSGKVKENPCSSGSPSLLGVRYNFENCIQQREVSRSYFC